jgi:ATP-dependent exoDNAse (exonuclease V) beta subunit
MGGFLDCSKPVEYPFPSRRSRRLRRLEHGDNQTDKDQSWPAGPFEKADGWPPKIRTSTGLEKDAIASIEGQTKAELEYKENVRLLYVGCTRAQSKLVFPPSQWERYLASKLARY